MKPTQLRRYRPGTNDPTSDYGHTSRTECACTCVHPDDAQAAMQSHLRGHWGECDPVVFESGDFESCEGVLRLTVHFDRHGTKFGVVTTRHRLETTLIMPDELKKHLQSVSNL
jgi:hypothetical protein